MKTTVLLDKTTKENLIYLRSVFESQTLKAISLSQMVRLITSFIIDEIEDDEKEKKIIEYIKNKLEGGDKNGQ